ncbi:hypothetical protein V8D89_002756, partial [Ganoderma adspersum]
MEPLHSASLHSDCAVLILQHTQLRSLGNVNMQTPNFAPSLAIDSQNATHPMQQHNAMALKDQQPISLQLYGSQLFTLEGTSIRSISPGELGLIPAHVALPTTISGPTRKGVRRACVRCRRLAKRCDAGRPCFRCVDMGYGESCKDAPTKPRKPYHKRRTSLAGLALECPQVMAATGIQDGSTVPIAAFEAGPQFYSAQADAN